MRGLNKVLLVGHIGREPELRTSAAGNLWCVLSVATVRPRKQEGKWADHTSWHRVKVFGQQAEACTRLLRAGSIVAVDGTLQHDQWVDAEGKNRHSTEVVAERVTFMSGFGASRRPPAEPTTAKAEAPEAPEAQAEAV